MENLKRVLHKQTLGRFKYSKDIQSTGVSFEEFCDYMYLNYETGEHIRESKLFGKSVKRNNTFWFVQNVEEVFVDEVYKFTAKNSIPYIIDCGSNIGLSLIYFKQNYPSAKILGFEPDPIVYDTCQYNMKSFGFTDIEVVNAAVWKEDGFISFLPDNCLGGKIVDDSEDLVSLNKVKSVRLKSYLNEKIDFLKIDIEGAEMDVLRDCKNDLGCVDNLFVEYHGHGDKPQDLQELLSIMEMSGFRYYIDSAWTKMKHPFVDHVNHTSSAYDLQLNVFAYRR